MTRRSFSGNDRARAIKNRAPPQLSDLLQELLLALGGRGGSAVVTLEDALGVLEELALPCVYLVRVQLVATRQLGDRLVLLDRGERDLGLERGGVLRTCPLLRHFFLLLRSSRSPP
jgi:hypothetical protein